MLNQVKIGLCQEWGFNDVFWVQVYHTIHRCSQEKGISLELLYIDANSVGPNSPLSDQEAFIDEIMSYELDVLIGWVLFETLIHRLLDEGLPIIHLSETRINHPLSVSPIGLMQVANNIASYAANHMEKPGEVLVIGGLLNPDRSDDGRSRIKGIEQAFSKHAGLTWHHIPSDWSTSQAYTQLKQALKSISSPVDAILGLSDSLALVGSQVALEKGISKDSTPVFGINGDPQAIQAIMKKQMTATIETSASALGKRAFEIACKIASGHQYPQHYQYEMRLITNENVIECAAEKLEAIASLPSSLDRTSKEEQAQYVLHLNTSLKIGQQIGSLLGDSHFPIELAAIIRSNYGYDRVQLLYWHEQTQVLQLIEANKPSTTYHLLDASVLAEALKRNQLLFIPDATRSFRFDPDPNCPNTRSRIVIPIRHGNRILGVLDLQADRVLRCNHLQRIALQSLADQVGVAIMNEKLYEEALNAKILAEKADALKTQLLANVSHELRNPLHLILNHTDRLSTESKAEVTYIKQNAQHLLRLINDLLDISRAEINELPIKQELVDILELLQDVFNSVTPILSTIRKDAGVTWKLELPDRLPFIEADPDRLRQILLNLLNNSEKFTHQGSITLGADIAPPYLHIWVEDTGEGISPNNLHQIFESFVVGERQSNQGGVGLGLSISRHLVMLHGGYIEVDSQLGIGSVFHIYLPLPNLTGLLKKPSSQKRPVMLVLSNHKEPNPEIITYSERQKLEMRLVRSFDDITYELELGIPSAIAWDTTHLREDDWEMLEYLRSYPPISTLPFLLYGPEAAKYNDPSGHLTGIMMKPVQAKSLLQMVNSLAQQKQGYILIIDDDDDVLSHHTDIIHRNLKGSICRTASSGYEAIAIMKQDIPPALVILDLIMPDVDGFQVIEWMRLNESTTHVPVVILSGKVLKYEDLKRLEPYSNIAFQSKNILSNEELVSFLQQIILDNRPLPPQTSALIKQAVAYIQENYMENFSRSDLANNLAVNENYLTRIFRQELGLTPWEYLLRYRVTQGKELLRNSHESIANIATRVGFDDPAYFSRVFRRYFAQSPSMYRSSSDSS